MPDRASAPRVAAIVGPYASGKTSLLESLLLATEAIHRKGTIQDHNTVGDSSPEARDREMGVEVNLAETTYLGGQWTFLDCPGSVEFMQDTYNALTVCDVAVVVCEPDPARAVMLTPLLKFLDSRAIPHMIFINKIETTETHLRDMIEALQMVSTKPLVAREIPIREDGKVVGYLDLVSERAYRYKPGEASDLISIPEDLKDRHVNERQELLENLADYDDALLEGLLSDVVPPKGAVYDSLARDLAEDLVVPVFFGGALADNGIRRLLKALRHESPTLEETRARLGIEGKGPVIQVFKTQHAEHMGKLSLARLWNGTLKDGQALNGDRATGLFSFPAGQQAKVDSVGAGAVVGIGKLEKLSTGALVGGDSAADDPPVLGPLFALALHARKQGDDVKLTGALAKLCEEDPSLRVENNPDTAELLLWGQGDIHLQIAVRRLARQFHVEVEAHRPQVPYKETIRKATSRQGRFKRQTGGHGQFGDVHLDIKPLSRGEGFVFTDSITGGVVPRQYIPAVEQGIREFLPRGPLGFPVVDVGVTLTDGSYHVVDSSEQAFKSAAQLAMREGMPACEPVLLEPILRVEISVPTDATSRAQRALTTRRGQILGYTPKEGWSGWDVVEGYLPQSEMHDLITDLRSATMGVGTFAWSFDHLQEVIGKQADEVVTARKLVLAG
ncbi:elongation factor G [Rhodospirillum rubrum]|uniref:Elongation factor G n=1 Tax=Rhodospirillum rubrum (strain ATCC 11170 / ATH 1.1.1 / DSM 467 / LMG 4362 / NCIMB 8255 / S1) TaxID=269796 RepID=Q2RVA4_RHORT|nr:elongation factor G [Rhodospirillum rubrum]ABC21941.1 Elongation factor G [Rhodospirillum rubrum ATCC 11170]MBK5953507.1 elongation factor G [Rhodospirillum rubrum]QXG81596.1 elongation factor G [Rhodospirillum rubrum]HAP99514.1 elongation factor G [Rhodospirillum rubrum]HCF17680.1 elongation factor G [Rhodospirillum rubrum]